MAEPTTRTKLTYEDLLALPEDGKRHEIIEGVHYVTPSPVPRHQLVVGNLYFLVKRYLRECELGEIYLSPLDVVFSPHDVVEPDLLYVSEARRSVLTDTHVAGSPELVVEVLSPGTRNRDLGVKRALYERSEVVEYWLADPEADSIEVLRRDEEGGLAPVVELSLEAGDRLVTPLLPGLEMPLAAIFPTRR